MGCPAPSWTVGPALSHRGWMATRPPLLWESWGNWPLREERWDLVACGCKGIACLCPGGWGSACSSGLIDGLRPGEQCPWKRAGSRGCGPCRSPDPAAGPGASAPVAARRGEEVGKCAGGKASSSTMGLALPLAAATPIAARSWPPGVSPWRSGIATGSVRTGSPRAAPGRPRTTR